MGDGSSQHFEVHAAVLRLFLLKNGADVSDDGDRVVVAEGPLDFHQLLLPIRIAIF